MTEGAGIKSTKFAQTTYHLSSHGWCQGQKCLLTLKTSPHHCMCLQHLHLVHPSSHTLSQLVHMASSENHHRGTTMSASATLSQLKIITGLWEHIELVSQRLKSPGASMQLAIPMIWKRRSLRRMPRPTQRQRVLHGDAHLLPFPPKTIKQPWQPPQTSLHQCPFHCWYSHHAHHLPPL